MEWILYFVDLFLHLDKHLAVVAEQYGVWLYLILIVIVFCETGLVVTPILPGDSLLFAAGALAAVGVLDISILFFTLFAAAILGDTVNYHIGQFIGTKAFKPEARFLKTVYLDKTHAFYEKYGGKTIVIARFVPIIRTFAPFVAGAGKMTYRHFIFFNILGAFLWCFLMLGAGYLLGTIPVIKNNFSIIVLLIVFISILPMVYEFIKHRREKDALNNS